MKMRSVYNGNVGSTTIWYLAVHVQWWCPSPTNTTTSHIYMTVLHEKLVAKMFGDMSFTLSFATILNVHVHVHATEFCIHSL